MTTDSKGHPVSPATELIRIMLEGVKLTKKERERYFGKKKISRKR
jgi:hypothetical protein